MSATFFEIIQLNNGDYALRRVDDDEAPLVRITFSPEAREMMQDRDMSVARAMISAGIDAVARLRPDMMWDMEEDPEMMDDLTDWDEDGDYPPQTPPTLH